jgi:hypothetical protein
MRRITAMFLLLAASKTAPAQQSTDAQSAAEVGANYVVGHLNLGTRILVDTTAVKKRFFSDFREI